MRCFCTISFGIAFFFCLKTVLRNYGSVNCTVLCLLSTPSAEVNGGAVGKYPSDGNLVTFCIVGSCWDRHLNYKEL